MLEKGDEWICSIKDLTDSELYYPALVRNANCQNMKRCKWHKVTSVNWLNYSNQKTSHINWKPNDLHTCPINSLFLKKNCISEFLHFPSSHGVWKSQKSIIQLCERSELLLHKSSFKNAKNGPCGDFLKTWRLRSNSVTKQVNFDRTKNWWKMLKLKILNTTFWMIFKHCAC